jgi:hypothetical protein
MNFKDVFKFDSMKDLNESIDYKNYKTKKELGGLLVVDESGRLPNFRDIIYYKGKYPTKRELKALYEEVIESGVKNFKIIYDCMVRSWDSFKDKFDGYGSEPTDEYVELILVESY